MSSEIMTREEQRIKVAEARGWKRDPNATMPWVWIMPNGKAWETEYSIPDYHTDANAQFEAWRGLSAGEQMMFLDFLGMVSRREGCFWLDAFNRHFCEIFLRTKGLLK